MVTATLEDFYPEMVARLSRSSVTKRYEAYRDVDWDADDGRIDPADPRFELPKANALGATGWYRALPPSRRAELGLDWTCQNLRLGISFESCLSRGLLGFAGTLPNGSSTYRYVMHEVIEESHHSMMFHEFIRRSGRAPHDLPSGQEWLQRRVADLGHTFPELFFLSVLSGEVFIDHDNKARLDERASLHPTLRRILQIHVTEEARHVCFANGYLRERLPRISGARRRMLQAILPLLLGRGERLMLRPSLQLIDRYEIPRRVLVEAFGASSQHAETVRKIVAPIEALLA